MRVMDLPAQPSSLRLGHNVVWLARVVASLTVITCVVGDSYSDATSVGALEVDDDSDTKSGSATPLERRIWEDVVSTASLEEATLLDASIMVGG